MGEEGSSCNLSTLDCESGKTVVPYSSDTEEASAAAGKEQTGKEESDSSADPTPAGQALSAEVATEELARDDEDSSSRARPRVPHRFGTMEPLRGEEMGKEDGSASTVRELGAGEYAEAAAKSQNEDGPPEKVCSGQHDHDEQVEGADAKEAELKTDDRVKASAEAQGEIVPLQSPASSACKASEV